MIRLLVIAVFSALALAKPELYKETEDFQYSRSSSDEGSKSGFYGAQRGNMGGNFEKAHNMDGLAQHQMSGLVRTVDGELGDGYKLRTGSVYSAANSRGIYGSGNYDLRNLHGRNFEETESFGGSHSSRMSQTSGFRSQAIGERGAHRSSEQAHSSGFRGYMEGEESQQFLQSDHLKSMENNFQRAHEYDYGNQATQYSSSGFQSHRSNYDQSNANVEHSGVYGADSSGRILTATPVRVVVRPGKRLTVPFTAQSYDGSRTASSFDIDRANINKETELLGSNGQIINYKPSITTNPKQYESSYSYHKAWEKHDTHPLSTPVVVPTENHFLAQSEEYNKKLMTNSENAQRNSNFNLYNSGASKAYTANTKSVASGRSRYQAGFNAQQSDSASLAENTNSYAAGGHSSSIDRNTYGYNVDNSNTLSTSSADGYNKNGRSQLSTANVNGYNTDSRSLLSSSSANEYNARTLTQQSKADSGSMVAADSSNIVELLSTKPKSYHSSYSYHKAWERQGDPYVIKPASGAALDGLTSQKLISASSNQGAYSHHYGSHYKQSKEQLSQNGFGSDCDEEGRIRVARSYDPYQETLQNMYQGQEDYEQQSQSHLEDSGQETQNQWDNMQDISQQTQEKFNKLEDLGQQTQNQWDNIQDISQQTQEKFNKLEDLGQQTQNQWDNMQDISQQTQEKFIKLEDLGQQTQNQWDNMQDISQQTQEKFNKLEDLGQQTQNHWDNIQDISQQTQEKFNKLEDLGQQTQNQWDNIQDISQQTQEKFNKLEDLGQQTQNQWDNTQDLGQQTQEKFDKLEDLGQQTQNHWDNIQDISQQTQEKFNKLEDLGQQTQNQWDNTRDLGQQTQEKFDKLENLGQQTQNQWDNRQDISQQTQEKFYKLEDLGQQNQNNLKGLDQQPISNVDQQIQPQGIEVEEKKKFWTVNGSQPLETVHNVQQSQNSKFDVQNLSLFNTEHSPNQQTYNKWNTAESTSRNEEKQFWKQYHRNLNGNVESSFDTTYKDENSYNNHYHNSQKQTEFHTQSEQNVSPLGNFWDKLNEIATKTLSNDNDEDNNAQKYDEHNSTLFTQQQSVYNSDYLHKQQNSTSSTNTIVEPQPILGYNNKKIQPKDVGRGDIGPEDSDLFPETFLNADQKVTGDLGGQLITKPNNRQSEKSLKSTTMSTDINKHNNVDYQRVDERNQMQTTTNTIYKQHLTNREITLQYIPPNPRTHFETDLDQENIDYKPMHEEQYTMNHQTEDFRQQTKELQNLPAELEGYGQQLQTGWQPEHNFKLTSENFDSSKIKDHHSFKTDEENYNSQKLETLNNEFNNQKINELQKVDMVIPTLPPPEAETEKPGFWKSVGSKLTNAKNKVYSWFSSS